MEKNNEKTMYVYLYEGQRVFLADIDDMKGVEPIKTDDANIGCYPIEWYNGCETCLTDDDFYGCYSEECEITISRCMNFENEQALTPYLWHSVDYTAVDEFERELCVRTTRYHSWKSELSTLIDYVKNNAEDHCITQSFADDARECWKKKIETYRSAISDDSPYDTPDVDSFDDILGYIGITIEESECE